MAILGSWGLAAIQIIAARIRVNWMFQSCNKLIKLNLIAVQGHWGKHVAESYVSGLVFGFFQSFCWLLSAIEPSARLNFKYMLILCFYFHGNYCWVRLQCRNRPSLHFTILKNFSLNICLGSSLLSSQSLYKQFSYVTSYENDSQTSFLSGVVILFRFYIFMRKSYINCLRSGFLVIKILWCEPGS